MKRILIVTILIILLMCGTASAWLSGYDHRVAIPVNNTGDVLTYYQYSFTMDTATEIAAGNMTYADGRDCQATDVSDNLLPFWNETTFNISNTKIWVNGTSLDNVTNTTHYLYYGKSGASSVADINAMACFGDSFEGSSLDMAVADSFSIEFTKAIGNYSCHGIPSVSNQSGDFYTGWHFSYKADVAGNSNENITKMVLYPNNNSNSSLGEIMGYDGYDHELVSQIEKLGSTYYAFFCNATSGSTNTQPWVIYYKNSSDGNTWSTPYALNMENSNMRCGAPRIIQMNDTVSWIVYTHKNASLASIRYIPFNATTKVFGSETDIKSGATGSFFYMPHALYESVSDQYFVYYWQAGSPNSCKVINRTGYGAWSSPTTVVANTGGAYSQPWVIYWNSKYYLFYHDSAYDLKVMDSTDGISFSAMQTIHSHASNYYWYPAVVPINSTHLAMVYGWHVPTNVKSIMYWDILEYDAGSSGRWEKKNSPTVSVANGICSVYYAGTTDWAGIIGNYSFGAYNYVYHQRVKYDSETGVFAGACDAWSDAGTHNDGMFYLEYSNGLYIRSRNNAAQQQTVGTSERTKYHTEELRWKSGEVKFYRDGYLNATHTTQVPDSALYPFFASFKSSGSGYVYIDWCFVRKYAATEPTTSVGSVEDAPVGNNIVLGANKYGLLRKNVAAAETFSTIAAGFTHDVCFTWWDDVTDSWLSYWVGDSYNSGQSIPEHESYFVLIDGTGETVSCSVAAAETVAIPIGWSCTYLRESTSKTLTAIKSDMGGNCVDLYAWNHTASGTGAWTDTGAYSVLPNQGLLVNASTGFNWDGAVP